MAFLMSNTVSETSFMHCPMMGDELLSKRSPDKNQRFFMINSIYHIYHVKYSTTKEADHLHPSPKETQHLHPLPDINLPTTVVARFRWISQAFRILGNQNYSKWYWKKAKHLPLNSGCVFLIILSDFVQCPDTIFPAHQSDQIATLQFLLHARFAVTWILLRFVSIFPGSHSSDFVWCSSTP